MKTLFIFIVICFTFFSYTQTEHYENGKLVWKTTPIGLNDDYFSKKEYYNDIVGAYVEIFSQNDILSIKSLHLNHKLPDSLHDKTDTIIVISTNWISKLDNKKTKRQKNKGKYSGSKTIDTLYKKNLNKEKLELYKTYLINNDLIDTFYIIRNNSTPIILGDKWSHRVKTECNYYLNKKHGTEIEYFSNFEIQTNYIKEPFIRHKGKWKNDLKHGYWFYFNYSGQITLTEKYKNGKLIRSKKI